MLHNVRPNQTLQIGISYNGAFILSPLLLSCSIGIESGGVETTPVFGPPFLPLKHCRGRCPPDSAAYNACSGSNKRARRVSATSEIGRCRHVRMESAERRTGLWVAWNKQRCKGYALAQHVPAAFVDVRSADACGNKSMRTGSRAWHSQMDVGAKPLLSMFQRFCRCRHQRCLQQQKHENRQQGMALAKRCRGHTLAQHIPTLLSMQTPEMPAATKAREQAAGHGTRQKMQGPDLCSACSNAFVDADTRDACSNKSTRTGSRAWHSQMQANQH